MNVDAMFLYIKIKLENIQELFNIGEALNAKILYKHGDNLFTIKIKNKRLEAFSNVDFQENMLIKLKVESLIPKIILKILPDGQNDRALLNTKLILLDRNNIKESVNNMKDYFKSIDIMFKDIQQLNNTQHFQNMQNIFFQMPIIINNNKNDAYIRLQAKKCKSMKNFYRITLVITTLSWGLLKIDAMQIERKKIIVISAFTRTAHETLIKHIEYFKSITKVNNIFLYYSPKTCTVSPLNKVDLHI